MYGGTRAATVGARHGSWCRCWRQLGDDGSNRRRGEETGAQQSEWVLEGMQPATCTRCRDWRLLAANEKCRSWRQQDRQEVKWLEAACSRQMVQWLEAVDSRQVVQWLEAAGSGQEV